MTKTEQQRQLNTNINAAARLASILLNQIESDFDVNRGKVDGTTVSLMFQEEGIRDTIWLALELAERTRQIMEHFDAEDAAA